MPLHALVNKAVRYLHTFRLQVYPTLPFRTESKLVTANRVNAQKVEPCTVSQNAPLMDISLNLPRYS
jgi:hypothetical protein